MADIEERDLEDIHQELLDNISDSYQKTEGFPTWDYLRAVAYGLKKLWNKAFLIDYLQDVEHLTGTDLERFVSQRKGISRRPATYSVGTLTIVHGTGTITAGALFESKGGIQFKSLEDKVVNDGDTITITAVKAGSTGNLPVGAICEMPITIQGISEVSNLTPTIDGYDAEDDNTLRERYLELLRRPPTSGNVYHYIYWSKEVSGVGEAKVFSLWQGDNTVQVVITDSEGLPPNTSLVGRVQLYIDPDKAGSGLGEAPVGAHCTVTGATALNLTVSATLTLEATAELSVVKGLITDRIKAYLKEQAFKSDYVSYGKIGDLIINTEGVVDYDQLKLNGTQNRIEVPSKSVAVLEEVDVSAS